jgi:hypothetical protein
VLVHPSPKFGVSGAKWFLHLLWPSYQAFLNGDEPASDLLRRDWKEHRRRVEFVLRGHQPFRRHSADAPLVLVENHGRVQWALKGPYDPHEALSSDEGVRQIRTQYRFVLMLLGLPESKGLLRRCNRCSRVFLGKRAHVRERSFCKEECRFAFNRSRQSKEEKAAYKRRWRKSKRELREAKARAKKGAYK